MISIARLIHPIPRFAAGAAGRKRAAEARFDPRQEVGPAQWAPVAGKRFKRGEEIIVRRLFQKIGEARRRGQNRRYGNQRIVASAKMRGDAAPSPIFGMPA